MGAFRLSEGGGRGKGRGKGLFWPQQRSALSSAGGRALPREGGRLLRPGRAGIALEQLPATTRGQAAAGGPAQFPAAQVLGRGLDSNTCCLRPWEFPPHRHHSPSAAGKRRGLPGRPWPEGPRCCPNPRLAAYPGRSTSALLAEVATEKKKIWKAASFKWSSKPNQNLAAISSLHKALLQRDVQ